MNSNKDCDTFSKITYGKFLFWANALLARFTFFSITLTRSTFDICFCILEDLKSLIQSEQSSKFIHFVFTSIDIVQIRSKKHFTNKSLITDKLCIFDIYNLELIIIFFFSPKPMKTTKYSRQKDRDTSHNLVNIFVLESAFKLKQPIAQTDPQLRY